MTTATVDGVRNLYIDLLIKCIANTIYGDPNIGFWSPKIYDPNLRQNGRDCPSVAHSMIGVKRLENLRECVETSLREEIPGDLIETGVWRGGACILMRGILRAHDVSDRLVYAADSFEGRPPPNAAAYPADAGDTHHTRQELVVSLGSVKDAFRAYGLLDGQIKFLQGWFKDTLPTVRDRTFAVIRLDGYMYESTIQALEILYPRLSPGGFAIIDDYGAVRGCQMAVDDYRSKHGISAPLFQIDWGGRYWRKPE